MYKRAYLYASNVPLINDARDDDITYDDDPSECDLNVDGNVIKLKPGSKVAYCSYCEGKLLLNNESIDKHINSKNHIKNLNKYKHMEIDDEKIKMEFNKRMESIDNRF